MNLPRQREKLKEIYQAKILATEFYHAALQAPVFQWSLGDRTKFSQEQLSFINEYVCTGDSPVPTISPYECFRVSYPEGFGQFWFSESAATWFMLFVDYKTETTPELWTANLIPCKAGARCEFRLFSNGKSVTERLNGEDGKIRPEVSVAMKSRTSWLCMFLCDLDMPGNVTLKVSPPSDGRSVEWRVAREHYLILNKGHAAQCRDSKKGPTDSQLVRGAHSRIAHFRRLKSEKFRHKRGQKVRVKQAWIGPEEWIGMDKKIYRVQIKNTH